MLVMHVNVSGVTRQYRYALLFVICGSTAANHIPIHLIHASCVAQGNIDPVLLFASEDAITEGVNDCIAKAGSKVIMNSCNFFHVHQLVFLFVTQSDGPAGSHIKSWTWGDGWNSGGKCCPYVCSF